MLTRPVIDNDEVTTETAGDEGRKREVRGQCSALSVLNMRVSMFWEIIRKLNGPTGTGECLAALLA